MTEEKVYDLGDKKSAISGRAKPIKTRLGDYLVKTSDIKECVFIKLDDRVFSPEAVLDSEDYYNLIKSGYHLSHSVHYGLVGKLSVSKIRKETGTRKKYWICGDKIPFEKEVIDWKLEVNGDFGRGELCSPKYLAKMIFEEGKKHTSIENQGVEMNLPALTDLLKEALDPYVQRVKYFCGEGGQFKRSEDYMYNCLGIEAGKNLLSSEVKRK